MDIIPGLFRSTAAAQPQMVEGEEALIGGESSSRDEAPPEEEKPQEYDRRSIGMEAIGGEHLRFGAGDVSVKRRRTSRP